MSNASLSIVKFLHFNLFIIIKISKFKYLLKENAIAFKDQVYSELKDQHDENNLFEDPEFPADNSSLYYSQSAPHGNIYKRNFIFFY